MFTRMLLAMLCAMLVGSAALADDDWGWDWDESETTDESKHHDHEHVDDEGLPLALHSLSLQSHGAYFGSGTEFLLGGAQVDGLGGTRHHNHHSINHPTYGVYPEVQHLFGNEDGFLGPMWGAPAGFGTAAGTAADSQASGGHPGNLLDTGFTFSVRDYEDDGW